MNENPQKEHGYTGIANEIIEALCRTNLSPYESRILWCIFRKTYGFQKKEDWIALSQLVTLTGMRKSHVSRAKKKLLDRKIVTQTGNKIAFNKFYTQWRELPKLVTVTQTGNPELPKQVIPLPKQGHTKETYTKETITITTEEILKWFRQLGTIESPEGYLITLTRRYGVERIESVWKKHKGKVWMNSSAKFVEQLKK